MNRFESHGVALARRMALTGRIQRFVDGTDRSVANAGLIEAGLDDAYPGNERIGAAVLMLSRYGPARAGSAIGEDEGGGRLADVLVQVLAFMR